LALVAQDLLAPNLLQAVAVAADIMAAVAAGSSQVVEMVAEAQAAAAVPHLPRLPTYLMFHIVKAQILALDLQA
jgi:hypothetical protein